MPFSDRFVELRVPMRRWARWQINVVIGVVVSGLSVSGLTGFLWYFSRDLPDLESIHAHKPSLVSRVYADNREVIGQYYIERRFFTPLTDIPDTLVEAVISVEDARFFEHPGLDVIGIVRAAWTNLRRGGKIEGASTITQQLARSLFLSSERTYTRKLKELILAYRIENRLSKEQILEMYLNQIYFGHGAYGVRAATQTFFEKPLAELTLEESALLAGLPKSPNNYSPYRNPERAKRRQEHVLARMEEAGFITASEREETVDKPLTYQRPEAKDIAPYFIEHVRQQLVASQGEEAVYRGGLDIFTTLNVEMQKAAGAAVHQGLLDLDKRQGWRGPLRTISVEELTALTAAPDPEQADTEPPQKGELLEGIVMKVARQHAEVLVGSTLGRLAFEDMEWARRRLNGPDPSKDAVMLPSVKGLIKRGDVIEVAIKQVDGDRVHWRLEQSPVVQGALIALDPRNGSIRAMVGGYDFLRSEYNRAVSAQRQAGSAFKPIIYATAIKEGLTPATPVLDAPIVYEDEETGKIWKPENYEKRFYGVISLREALMHSRNLATVRLLGRVGIKDAIELAEELGISSPLNYDLSLSLGSSSVTLQELTSAYGVFANQGYLNRPYSIAHVTDADQQALEQILFEPKQVLSIEQSYLITNMLYDVVQRGTGRRAKAIRRPIAGKTGTTNDFTDAWFVGYTPNLSVGVWVGFDDRRTLGERESGANAALPIWIAFMKGALKQLPVIPFEIPDDIQFVKVDPATGLLASDNGDQGIVEIFAAGTEPTTQVPERLDPMDFYNLDRFDQISVRASHVPLLPNAVEPTHEAMAVPEEVIEETPPEPEEAIEGAANDTGEER